MTNQLVQPQDEVEMTDGFSPDPSVTATMSSLGFTPLIQRHPQEDIFLFVFQVVKRARKETDYQALVKLRFDRKITPEEFVAKTRPIFERIQAQIQS